MNYGTFQNKPNYEQFGTILIFLGIISIAYLTILMIEAVIGFRNIFSLAIRDIMITIALIFLLVNNSKIKSSVENPHFRAYFGNLTTYAIIYIPVSIFYYIRYLMEWYMLGYVLMSTWYVIYDVFLIIAFIFFIIAWTKLIKFAEVTFNLQSGRIIRSGATFLVISRGVQILQLLLDLSAIYVYSHFLSGLVKFFGLAQGVLAVIGYFLVGINLKRMYSTPLMNKPSFNGKQKCANCGGEIIENTEFCGNCGKSLNNK